MARILAFDVGGSGLRAAVVGADGSVGSVAIRQVASALDGTSHEIDADAWWQLLPDAAAEALAGGTADAVAVTGMTRTQVLTDAAGRPVRAAIAFRDARAAAEVEAAARALAASPTYSPATVWHLLPRLLWLARHEPEALAAARHVLEPKDYLGLHLTGRAAGDPVSLASLVETRTGALASGAFARSGIDPALLPALVLPGQAIGAVLPGLPAPLDRLAGRPVAMAALDTWCGVLGIGGLRSGMAYNVSGTTEVIGLLAPRAEAVPELVTLPWTADLMHSGGPSQAGADCLQWLAEILGMPLLDVVAAAEAAPRHAEQLLFLPYLSGERVPLWRPDARGAFFGLHRTHGAADMARAVMEGVALANRQVLALAEAATGLRAGELRVTGGGAQIAAWCQAKADILQRPLVRTSEREAGLLGAAICARLALGASRDLAEAQGKLVRVDKRFEPDAARAAAGDRAYSAFLRLQAAALPLFAAGSAAVSPSAAPPATSR